MRDAVTKIKVLHLKKFQGENIAVVAIEQGVLSDWNLFKSDRTGTQYRLTDYPVFLTDMQMLVNPQYPEILCDYYRSREDFATNEAMQQICKTKRGFNTAPILFAKIVIIPFTDRSNIAGHRTWQYDDAPEKFDVEVGDTFTRFDM